MQRSIKAAVWAAWIGVSTAMAAESPVISLERDDEQGVLEFRLGEVPVVGFRYGSEWALPHYWPVLSPEGRKLTVQIPDPYPHHRSVWIADRVQLAGHEEVDFYHCWKNTVKPDSKESGYRHFIRHQSFLKTEVVDRQATVRSELLWIINQDQPVLREFRTVRMVALENGEYFMDLQFELRADFGEVTFRSDWVHYAWPYVRMHPEFSVDGGGVLVDDQGRSGQARTNGKAARWIDNSRSFDGQSEGLAIFVYPTGEPPKWLTRDYGTLGPRRNEPHFRGPFKLAPSEVLKGRVGLLIHRGDAESGNVASRYRDYAEGRL